MPSKQQQKSKQPRRQFAIGAEVIKSGVSFRVWAPKLAALELHLTSHSRQKIVSMAKESAGYFAVFVPNLKAGTLYKFRTASGSFPDPASRFQPEGPHGPSQVVASDFKWTDHQWHGLKRDSQVIYELHIGTFTPEGTWRSAIKQLPELANLGITTLEVMPVADFPGRFGWGYDGVNMFAPTRLYGSPDDFRAFVNAAHRLGLGVLLDVVYNHLGPDGNYLRQFSDDYFTDRHKNEWGEAINFDGPNSGPVREFFITNAAYWVEEFHIDGLRLDATQQIFDASEDHVLAAITRAVRKSAGKRSAYLVAENEAQDPGFLRSPKNGGLGLDAMWNDDLHHSARVALTGHSEGYYIDYRGTPQEFISAAKYGFLFQGQQNAHRKKRRGQPSFDLHPRQFVNFLQNHDQVANSLRGERLSELSHPGDYRALTALLLLGPGTPMLFQGQESGAATPFLYFADHHPDLAKLVSSGRKEYLKQFPRIASAEAHPIIDDPESEQTFLRCRLDPDARRKSAPLYLLHRDLLRLRREDGVFGNTGPGGVDGAVLGHDSFVLRFFGNKGNDRLLVVNLGGDLFLPVVPEPLLAPPQNCGWQIKWSSEHPAYGGNGTPPVEQESGWQLPGHSAVAFVAVRLKKPGSAF